MTTKHKINTDQRCYHTHQLTYTSNTTAMEPEVRIRFTNNWRAHKWHPGKKKSWILYLFIIYLCIHHIIFIHFHSNHPIIRLLPRKTSLNFLIDAKVTLSDFYEICIMRSSIVSGLDPSGPCHPTFFIVRNLEEGRYVKHNSLWHSDAIYRHNYRPGDHFTKKRASFQSELAFSFTTVCRKLASFWKKLARFLMCFTKLLAFCDPENT